MNKQIKSLIVLQLGYDFKVLTNLTFQWKCTINQAIDKVFDLWFEALHPINKWVN